MEARNILIGFLLLILLLALMIFFSGGTTRTVLHKQEPFFKRIIPYLERCAFPGYSYCQKCGRPWAVTDGHTTDYGRGWGTFPLCKTCWEVLETPENRLPYYLEMMEMYDYAPEKRPLIIQAVLDGK